MNEWVLVQKMYMQLWNFYFHFFSCFQEVGKSSRLGQAKKAEFQGMSMPKYIKRKIIRWSSMQLMRIRKRYIRSHFCLFSYVHIYIYLYNDATKWIYKMLWCCRFYLTACENCHVTFFQGVFNNCILTIWHNDLILVYAGIFG